MISELRQERGRTIETKAEKELIIFSIFFCGCKQSKSFHNFILQRYKILPYQTILCDQ